MCYYKTDEFMQQSGRIDSQIGKNLRFESSVNSEGIETVCDGCILMPGLRAV